MRVFGGIAALVATMFTVLISEPAKAEYVVVYNSRHYEADKRLFSDFEAMTGIRVVLVEDTFENLVGRMKA